IKKDTITTMNYQISRLALKRETHKGAKQDVQVALGNLLEKYDKDKETKDELKGKVEKITTALLTKITQPGA
ncbi:hypothetical protein KI387_039486, partial [Taxus chinensis]